MYISTGSIFDEKNAAQPDIIYMYISHEYSIYKSSNSIKFLCMYMMHLF